MMSPYAAACAKLGGRSGDTTPGTRNANPMKRKLCRMRRGRNASARCRVRSSGQIYRAETIPQAIKLNAMLMKNESCDTINSSFLEFECRRVVLGWRHRQSRTRAAKPRPRESLQRSWVQCPQRHQRSDGDVLVIHQLFLRERQRFHDGSRLVLGLGVDQEDNALAIAARIPLADFPVEVELHGCPNLCRYNIHDLLRIYTLPGGLNDQYSGGFRY